MSPRTIELILSAAFLVAALVPIAWPGTGPTVVSFLLSIAGVIAPVTFGRA